MVGAVVMTDATEIATQAIEAAAGIASLSQSFRIVSQARKYYDLYAQQKNFYYNTFHTGVETPLVNDVYSIPVYTENYSSRVNTAYGSQTGPFGGASADILGWWKRHAGMYDSEPDSLITELTPTEARLKSDWTNYLFRFEELWADIRNDDRWMRRLTVHNIGIKQGTAVSAMMQAGLENYQENVRDLGNQLATYANGIAQAVGYKRGLNDTASDFGKATQSAATKFGDIYDEVRIGELS